MKYECSVCKGVFGESNTIIASWNYAQPVCFDCYAKELSKSGIIGKINQIKYNSIMNKLNEK